MADPTSGDRPPGAAQDDGDEAGRRRLEALAQARFWAEEYHRRLTARDEDLVRAREHGGPVVRAALALAGGSAVQHAARTLARRRDGATLEDPGCDNARRDDPELAEAQRLRAVARERVARADRGLALVQYVAAAPGAARSRVTGAGASVVRAAVARVPGALPARRTGMPATRDDVTVVALGDPLCAVRSARALGVPPGDPVVAADPAALDAVVAVAATRYLLIVCGLRAAPSTLIDRLVAALEADAGRGAVAPLVRDAAGEVDAGWRFGWRDGSPIPVPATTGGAPPVALGATCLLVRTGAISGAAPPAATAPSASAWALDLGLRIHAAGATVAVADVEVTARSAAGRPGASDGAALCVRWGPLLRRRVLGDLVAGGGFWCERSLHAAGALPGLHDSCDALAWEAAPAAEADVLLDPGEDRGVLVRWRGGGGEHEDEPGALLRLDARSHPDALRTALADHLGRTAVCLQIASRDRAAAATSGDRFLAEALARALRRRGHWTRVQTRDEAADPRGLALDAVVHLRGRAKLEIPEGRTRVLWLISHPDEVDDAELERHDLVLVASRPYAAKLAARLRVPVRELLQFTDPEVFRPVPARPPCHDLLFVGNWRSVLRRAVWAALLSGHDLGLYGQGWRHVSSRHAHAEHVPNERLHELYSSARIVLADHWDDMRREGFVANRVFDALASGAFVFCDDFQAVRELLPGGVATYDSADGLRAAVDRYLADASSRERTAVVGRRTVLENHTVDRRAGELSALLAACAIVPCRDAEAATGAGRGQRS